MSKAENLNSTIDSILNENNGATTYNDNIKNKNDVVLYNILSGMTKEELETTQKKVERMIEKKISLEHEENDKADYLDNNNKTATNF